MAAYEILLLNTAIPQIQAAQSGDTYVVPRDIAFSAALTLTAGTANGVPYLSSPGKVLTTGSALTFDGLRLTVGGSDGTNFAAKGATKGIRFDFDGTTSTIYGVDNTFFGSYEPLAIGGSYVTFKTSGTEQMRLTSTGLGIGTNSPQGPLEVAATGATVNQFLTGGTGNNAVTGIFRIGSGAGRGASIQGFRGASSNIHSLDFYTYNSADVFGMRLDSSGNLGLGVTPSAWGAGVKALQIGTGASLINAGVSGDAYLGQNVFFNGTNNLYINTQSAGQYAIASGVHTWYNAPSGTANTAITFTQAMTLDASGRLLVGVTSGNYALDVGDVSGGNMFRFTRSGVELSSYISSGLPYFGTTSNTALLLMTNNAECARITSGGYFKTSNTGTYLSSTGTYHEFNSDDASNATLVVRSTSASFVANTLQLRVVRNTTNGTFFPLRYYNEGAGADKFLVADSGDVTNTNGSYGTISDAKMKTDIVDAGSQWSDIKALRFRKFKMKNDPSGLVQLGVVAQEVELTSPGLVDEHQDKDAEGNDLGTTTKSVKTSVLLMKAAVALQEAMARIEKLEAEVAALKGA